MGRMGLWPHVSSEAAVFQNCIKLKAVGFIFLANCTVFVLYLCVFK